MEYQYVSNPELLEHVREFFICVIPTVVLLFNIDILRQLNLGMSNYLTCFICEIVNTITSIFFPFVFAFWFQFGYYGIIFGTAVGQLGGYISQVVFICFAPYMKDFRMALFSCKKNLLTQDEEDIDIDPENGENITKYDNLSFY